MTGIGNRIGRTGPHDWKEGCHGCHSTQGQETGFTEQKWTTARQKVVTGQKYDQTEGCHRTGDRVKKWIGRTGPRDWTEVCHWTVHSYNLQ